MRSCTIWIGILSLALSGCYNASMYRTAEPLQRGQVSLGTGVGYTGFPHSQTVKAKTDDPNNDNDGIAEIPFITLPYNDYFVRVGVGGGVDIGLKYSVPLALAADVKIRFLKVGNFSMALDPGADFSSWIFLHRVGVDLPLLASVRLGRMFQIYGGVRFFYNYWMCSALDECDNDLKKANSLYYGGFVGISIEVPIGPVDLFLRPEFHYYRVSFVGLKNDLNWIQPGIGIGIRFGGASNRPIPRRVAPQPAPAYQAAPSYEPAPAYQPTPAPQGNPQPAPTPDTSVPPPVAPDQTGNQ